MFVEFAYVFFVFTIYESVVCCVHRFILHVVVVLYRFCLVWLYNILLSLKSMFQKLPVALSCVSMKPPLR